MTVTTVPGATTCALLSPPGGEKRCPQGTAQYVMPPLGPGRVWYPFILRGGSPKSPRELVEVWHCARVSRANNRMPALEDTLALKTLVFAALLVVAKLYGTRVFDRKTRVRVSAEVVFTRCTAARGDSE